MTVSIGQTLDDRYLIEAHIGSGGMARVFRARNQRTGKSVAVKEIYIPANEQADTLRGWLRREIKALMVLDHPNVVQLIDHGETPDGTPWVVTELLDGKDLEDWVKQRGPMSDAAMVDVALQALSAFTTAHRLSIVHRDIKPGNLFLCNTGRVVVLDFGLARATSGEVSSTLAEGFGTKIMGTPQYWSPEQIRGVTLDVKSDVFSLGGTFYYLLSGKPPFLGNTAFEIASQIMMKKRLPLAQVAPHAAPALVALVEEMLAEDNAVRKDTTDLLARFEHLAAKMSNTKPALMQYITQVEPPAAPGDHTNIVTVGAQTRKSRSKWPLAVAAGLLAAGLAAAFWPSKAPIPRPAEAATRVAQDTALPAPAEPPPVPEPMPVQPAPVPDKPAPKIVEIQGPGVLSVTFKQWAEVIIDGQSHGKQQIGAKLNLPSGKHDIVFKNAKFGERKTTVVIRANKETALRVDFEAGLP